MSFARSPTQVSPPAHAGFDRRTGVARRLEPLAGAGGARRVEPLGGTADACPATAGIVAVPDRLG